jgi:hypothetical protein
VSKFRHPHLTRGIVHTASGAFAICRGIVDAPERVGREYGWLPVDDEIAAGERADGQGLAQRPPVADANRAADGGWRAA